MVTRVEKLFEGAARCAVHRCFKIWLVSYCFCRGFEKNGVVERGFLMVELW
jgi:hypothetical protein